MRGRIHYEYLAESRFHAGGHYERTACGAIAKGRRTRDPVAVTCSQCRATIVFRDMGGASLSPGQRAAAEAFGVLGDALRRIATLEAQVRSLQMAQPKGIHNGPWPGKNHTGPCHTGCNHG